MFLFVYALRMVNWMYMKFPTKMKFQTEAFYFWSFGRLELAKFFQSTYLEKCLLTSMKICACNYILVQLDSGTFILLYLMCPLLQDTI